MRVKRLSVLYNPEKVTGQNKLCESAFDVRNVDIQKLLVGGAQLLVMRRFAQHLGPAQVQLQVPGPGMRVAKPDRV